MKNIYPISLEKQVLLKSVYFEDLASLAYYYTTIVKILALEPPQFDPKLSFLARQ